MAGSLLEKPIIKTAPISTNVADRRSAFLHMPHLPRPIKLTPAQPLQVTDIQQAQKPAKVLNNPGVLVQKRAFVRTALIRPHTIQESQKDYSTNSAITPIFSSRRPGKLNELLLVTTEQDFTVHLQADGREILNHTFAELCEVGTYVGHIDAFVDDVNAVVHISQIEWASDASARLSAPKGTLLKQMLVMLVEDQAI